MDGRTFHTDGFAQGVTTQPLAGGGLPPDPLAPDTGTVAYIIHTKGPSWAAVVVYDPTTRRYRHVCDLVGEFENASDIQTFDPLVRSVLATVHERGFPTRVANYTPDVRTMALAQYEDAVPPPAPTHRTTTPPSTVTMPAASPSPEPQPRTAQQTLLLLAAGGTGLVLLALSGALLAHLFFRHREQMAVVRTATRQAPLNPRPTAVPAPPQAAGGNPTCVRPYGARRPLPPESVGTLRHHRERV